jgi:hypothetical protein
MRFLGTLPQLPNLNGVNVYTVGCWFVKTQNQRLNAYNLASGEVVDKIFQSGIATVTTDGYVAGWSNPVATHFLDGSTRDIGGVLTTMGGDVDDDWFQCDSTSWYPLVHVKNLWSSSRFETDLLPRMVRWAGTHSSGSTFLVVTRTFTHATLYNIKHDSSYNVVVSVSVGQKFQVIGATDEAIIFRQFGKIDVWSVDKTLRKRHVVRSANVICYAKGTLLVNGRDVYKTTTDGVRWEWITACVA